MPNLTGLNFCGMRDEIGHVFWDLQHQRIIGSELHVQIHYRVSVLMPNSFLAMQDFVIDVLINSRRYS